MAWLPEGLALTLFLPPYWEELLEYLAPDFQILLWNSHEDVSSVLGGCSCLEVPYLVCRGCSRWLFPMRMCVSAPSRECPECLLHGIDLY